jgi:hypothetical protein
MKRGFLCGLAAATLLSFASYSVRACGYHGVIGDGFSAQYPGSIAVAIALREAADRGLIDAASLTPTKADLLAYHRAVQRLQKLRDIFASNNVAHARSFALLLVESAFWSRYANDQGRMSVDVHVGGPRPGEAVVLTGEAVIAVIEAGKLSWQDALRRGLIVIASGETGAAALHDLHVVGAAVSDADAH